MLICDPLVSIGLRVKLLDFGIARFEPPAGTLTTEQGMLGTPMYMSPEQCRGTGSVGTASDVYSLGVLLYQLLAGRPPFQSAGIGELVVMHLLRPPPPLHSLFPELPDSLRELVTQMLAKEPQERPSIDEIEKTLESLVRQRGTVVGVPSEEAPSVGTQGKPLAGPPISESLAALLGSDIEPAESIEHLSAHAAQSPQTGRDSREEGLSGQHLAAMKTPGTRRLMMGVALVLSLAVVLITVRWSQVRARRSESGAPPPVTAHPAKGTLSLQRGLTYAPQPDAGQQVSSPPVPTLAKEQLGVTSHEQTTATSAIASGAASGRVHQSVTSHHSILKPGVSSSSQSAKKTTGSVRNPPSTARPTRQIPPSPASDSGSHGTAPFLVID